jgi:4-amino-4-deoxy-L-arabinose transferase-like glycosyltransferase
VDSPTHISAQQHSENTTPGIIWGNKAVYYLILVLAILVNIAGISTKFFTDDPGLYALIGKTMAQNNDFVNLYFQGHDWLDKPHFPFWMIAISFKLFGINTIAYKLPGLAFYFMSVVYTYKLAKRLYNVNTALIAILVLLTAQHAIMSNTDVRAEPYIMGLLMGSVYHFYKVKLKFRLVDMLLACLYAGCAVMTKGIYVLIPIGFAIIGEYVFKGQWKDLLHWKWFLAILLVAVCILPEIYTLYQQFDLHPEKVVFDRRGVSGIHWFLWDSQFGRFNSTGYIKRSDGSVFFFLHTLLWAFAPWAFLFYYALGASVVNVFKKRPLTHYVALFGALPMLLIFSISQFQLPFYTNILFPFFSIITAVYLVDVIQKRNDVFFKTAQYVCLAALVLIIILLNFVFAPEHSIVFIVFTLALIGLGCLIYKISSSIYQGLFLFTCVVSIYVNSYFAAVVYPILTDHKGDVAAADYINENYPKSPIVLTCNIPNAFPFYVNHQITVTRMSLELQNPNRFDDLVLVDDTIKSKLEKGHTPYNTIKTFKNYPNEVLTRPFIFKQTRYQSLNNFYLIRFTRTANDAFKSTSNQ